MPLFAKDLTELTADSLNDLSASTNITKLTTGAKARALLDAVNNRIVDAYNTFDLNLTKAFVSSAPGQYLDLIGELVGVTRTSAVAANITQDMQVLRFYVDTDTFGDYNSSQNILIPRGTLVSTRSGGAGIVYRVSSDQVLLDSDSEAYIDAEAMNPGEAANVGRDVLRYHNFTGYSDYLSDTLKVSNAHPIASGSNLETDANYRFRISNRVLEAEAANETSIRLAALSTPGVANVLIIPRYRGIGTFGLLIESVSPTVTNALVTDVTSRVELVQALGTLAFIRGPHETGITFRTTVEYHHTIDDVLANEIESSLEQTIREYVLSLGIGEEFLVNRLVNEMFTVSTEIKNFGIVGTPIEEMYIYTDSKTEDSRVKEKLLGDYTPDFDERVVIETTIKQPMVFDRSFARR